MSGMKLGYRVESDLPVGIARSYRAQFPKATSLKETA
jgi:hypothetical protein